MCLCLVTRHHKTDGGHFFLFPWSPYWRSSNVPKIISTYMTYCSSILPVSRSHRTFYYEKTYLVIVCAAPWHILCLSTFFHDNALFTILRTSKRPNPNLRLYRFPAPLIFHPSSNGLVICDVSTITCCTSRQVSFGLN